MPNINIERLAQQKTRITEIHLPPIPDVPASLLKFPGVKEWNQQLKLMRERDQEQLYRALLNKGGETETAIGSGEKGDKGDPGEQGLPGQAGDDGAAGGAPSAATYIVQVPDATLTNEQALSLLTTGILKSTTATGVVSIAVAGTDYQIPLIAGTDYEVPLTFTGPLSRAINTISIPVATGSADGYLSAADWTIFNSKPPSDATYITQTASAGLSAEQALGALATGILKSTTTTGVVSIAVQGTDYYAPGGTDVAVADGGTGASTAAGARTNLGLVIGTDVEVPLTFSAPLSRAVNTISIPQANGSTDGFLDSADWTIFNDKQSALPVADTTAIVKGSVTSTKLLRFEVDGFTAATTRVITPPDADIALAGTNIANTWALMQSFESEVRSITHTGEEANTEFSVFNADTLIYTYQVLGNGSVLFGGGTAQIAADGIYTGPRMEVELSFEVQTRAGEETDIEFAVYNLDTTTETFHILGNGSFVSDGTATIGSLTGVIIGTAGVLSAVAALLAVNGGTGFAGYAVGDILYADSPTTLVKLPIGGDSNVLMVDGIAPIWSSIGLAGSTITGILPATKGGTGFDSYAVGDILYANTTTTLAKLADIATGNALISGGVGVAPSWGKIALTTHISGTLPIANGGTNATSYGASRIIFMNSANTALSSDSNLTWDLITLKMGATVPGVAYVNKISINETAAAAAHIITHNNTTTGYGHWTISNGAAWNSQFGLMRMYGAAHAANHYMSLDSVTNADFFIILAQGCANGLAIGSPDDAPVRFFTNDRERIKLTHTGGVEIKQPVITSGNPALALFSGAAHTGLTASAETVDVNFNLARIVQHATGAITTQRAMRIQSPTYSFVAASTITTAATLAISAAPTAGTNATITTGHALWVEAGTSQFDGGVRVTNLADINGIVVKGFSGQTVHLVSIQNSASTIVSSLGARGDWNITPTAASSGVPTHLGVVGASHTALTASSESNDVFFNLARDVQHATGALTTQRAVLIAAPTYTFVGASTITNAATLAITAAPIAGTNATITNAYALWVQTGIAKFDGKVVMNDTARLKGYTVATLPAGTQGDVAFVTDALAPGYLAAVVGGGVVVTPVFFNGASWIAS